MYTHIDIYTILDSHTKTVELFSFAVLLYFGKYTRAGWPFGIQLLILQYCDLSYVMTPTFLSSLYSHGSVRIYLSQGREQRVRPMVRRKIHRSRQALHFLAAKRGGPCYDCGPMAEWPCYQALYGGVCIPFDNNNCRGCDIRVCLFVTSCTVCTVCSSR